MRFLRLLAIVVIPGVSVFGQYRDARPGYDRRAFEPLDYVRADLERAASDMRYLSHSEIKRIRKVREEIGEFQRKWERGRYDRGELNDVIRSLEKVVDRNRLQPRDRDRLLGDIARLREFGARRR